jgi:hypothetical protein
MPLAAPVTMMFLSDRRLASTYGLPELTNASYVDKHIDSIELLC